MLKIVCYCAVLASATSLWSQVEPSATGSLGFALDDTRMMTPPPVSRDAYPVVVGVESHANYFGAGLIFSAAYADNLIGVESTKPVSDETYSFLPTVSIDRRGPRQGESLNYSAGFNLYQNTSQLNGVSQNGSADYRFHISPYAVVVVSDTFWQNSNLYNQTNPFVAGGVSTGSNSLTIAPFANQISNFSSAGINYQYGKNAMIGGSGSYSFTHFSSGSQNLNLNDEDSSGAVGFYSRRLAPSQYVGVTYQLEKSVTHPVDTYTLTHTVFGFYTHYFTKSISFSILAGPENYASWSPTVAKQGHWVPAIQGSVGWQTLRTNLTASFTHTVSGAPGLIGAFHANMASLNGRLMFSRMWSIGASADYSLLKSVEATPSAFAAGGHTITGGVDLEHVISERLSAAAGYQHLHETYAEIPAILAYPDSNRVYFSLNYGFHRPLGR